MKNFIPHLALATVAALLMSCGGGSSGGLGGNAADASGSGGTGAGGGTGSSSQLTVIVMVVDSLVPADLGLGNTPNMDMLVANGTSYEESRAVFAAETIPNHVAMMTGVTPRRNGVPTNNFWDKDTSPGTPDRIDLSLPKELSANTLFTWIGNRCGNLSTGAALSKKYLYEIFFGDDPGVTNDNPNVFNVQPDNYWDPTQDPLYIPDPSEHTPDLPTMNQALAQLPDSDFLFINLGDVDRSAHAAGEGFRAAKIAETDIQVGRLVTALMDAGRWENTVLIMVSDHGMDFSLIGNNVINTQPALDQLEACGYEPMVAIKNDGTDGVYVTNLAASANSKQETLRAARACLLEPDGAACTAIETACGGASIAPQVTSFVPVPGAAIAEAWYVEDDPVDTAGNMPPSIDSHHENFGDLVLIASDGYKFGDPNNTNAGNHGHFVTMQNSMVISGGADFIKAGNSVAPSSPSPGPLDRLPEQSENIDVAPTVAWLLGLGIQPADFPDFSAGETQGFDGRVLSEAFTPFDTDPNAASPSSCGVIN